ncbi:MAG: plasmid recombination protein [Lachnospiraceae bacterium]|nr:plasmid recombination protein [Lachnospiraceae bacterium]
MHQELLTYAEAEECYYEAMRINKGGSSEWSALKEGNALIDVSRTHLNYELADLHKALNPSNYGKGHRGEGIAGYHKSVTGKGPRMKGEKKQMSKAVGLIATLPKDFMEKKYKLTEAEYQAVVQYMEHGHCSEEEQPKTVEFLSAMEKMKKVEYTDKELKEIKKFFTALFKAWKKNAGIRDEDILYAVVHLDESTPHLHVMALPTMEKKVKNEEGKEEIKITFSTDKFCNKKTGYFDKLHENVIKGMQEQGVDGSGLLNGATKNGSFKPGDYNKQQREAAVELALAQREMQSTMEQQAIKIAEKDKELKISEELIENACTNADKVNKKLIETLVELGEEVPELIPTRQILEQKKKKNTPNEPEEVNQTMDLANRIIVFFAEKTRLVEKIWRELIPQFTEAYKRFSRALEHFFEEESQFYAEFVKRSQKHLEKGKSAREKIEKKEVVGLSRNMLEGVERDLTEATEGLNQLSDEMEEYDQMSL